MQQQSPSHTAHYTLTTALAIFSMIFGAGNLIYPLLVGIQSGSFTAWGMAGFLITAALLPLSGLITMILFDGNYQLFFGRLGHIPGNVLIFIALLIIGPGIAIPRITSLSFIMITPFIPFTYTNEFAASFVFTIVFLTLTFLLTYKENNIIDVLGKVISPLLLFCVGIIIIKGIATAQHAVPASDTPFNLFKTNFMRGYETLDLLGTLFFGSIIIALLKKQEREYNPTALAMRGLTAGILGIFFLCMIYIGMSVLSMFHGHGMAHLDGGSLFREISFKVVGSYGAGIISTAVLMACLSTAIALSAVVAEYIQKHLCNNKISHVSALIITLLSSIPLSLFGLKQVLALTGGPIVYIGYPVFITLTICNLLYKLVGFKPVKIPVLLTFIAALISYVW